MQSEELEEVNLAEATPSAVEMTFGDTKDCHTPNQIRFPEEEFNPAESIKVEVDVDAIMPDSPESLETIDELPKPKEPTAQENSESIRSWLQRITQMQNEIQKKLNFERISNTAPSFAEYPTVKGTNANPPQGSRVVKYQDLPYMGEMTLDNSKPRRGRKPKKADICHLIYKNYGTIFPGTPNPRSLLERDSKKSSLSMSHEPCVLPETVNRSDVQNRIISSLLEKRLTQESRRNKDSLKARHLKRDDQNEPLNLCIRDLNQLKIRLLKKNDLMEVKSEPHSDDEVEFVHETPSPGTLPPIGDLGDAKGSETNTGAGGYVYWPNAGIFIHPMALQQQLMYYQRLAANNNYTLPNNNSARPIPEGTVETGTSHSELRKIVSKTKSRNKVVEQTEEVDASPPEPKTKRNAPVSAEKTPTKRKRSAIFIPPIPAENQTNPATEVSICKFKFTGGAKPSLQEKKMLSVDSGGNFRYYSGTGDKSMRGYEFFPRETLQQQIGNTQGSSTGAFLQASGEKIYPSSPVEFTGKPTHSEFLLSPDLPAPALAALPELGVPRHKKRKSRKSLQREKLEQTFKEKGFLIQTQQLESAEGATYCKFRQLRKFTRYLFRSWKDYLPGNLKELQEGEEPIENDEVLDHDLENLSRHSSSTTVANDA